MTVKLATGYSSPLELYMLKLCRGTIGMVMVKGVRNGATIGALHILAADPRGLQQSRAQKVPAIARLQWNS